MSFQKYLKENEQMEYVIRKSKEVLSSLVHAKLILEELHRDWLKTGKRTTDFLRFKSMVSDIISSDHGQSGFGPFIEQLESSLETKPLDNEI